MHISIKKRRNINNILAIIAVVVIIFACFILISLQKNNKKGSPVTVEVIDQAGLEADKVLVENYLRKNIEKLTPERSVLGGTWYMKEININITNKTGTFKYEDGHIEGEAEFKFTKSNDNLLSIGIKKKTS